MAKIVELPRANHLTVIDSKELMGDRRPPEVNPQTGLPDALQAFVVSSDPKMTVIPHFFSEVECDHLIQLVEGCWMPSLVGGANYVKGKSNDFAKDAVENTVSQTRTSWSCMLRYAQTDVVQRLEHRIASIAGLPHGVAQMERMNMVRYAPGEFFNEHHDGKFRPKTIFVYLNDMEDGEHPSRPEDHDGDTFFPVLGYSFKPRRGTAVMWENATADGQKEDSRMVHAGRAPLRGVKYGVNCFTNEKPMRELVGFQRHVTPEEAVVTRVADLAEPGSSGYPSGPNEKPSLKIYEVVTDPKLIAIPGFLQPEEVEHFLEMANGITIQPTGPFRAGTQTLRHLPFEATPTVLSVEGRMVAVSGEPLDNLAQLRIVRPSTEEGLCNRGCGKHSIYVCLRGHEEVFFPRLGLRFILAPGDALSWPNVNFETGSAREEMRTYRVHRYENGAESAIGLDAYFHDNPLRAQQKVRAFVSDDDVLGK